MEKLIAVFGRRQLERNFFISIKAMISNKLFKLKYPNVVPQSGLHPLLNEI
jgi:hypothetical protein